MPAFRALFDSPTLLAQAAANNEDLSVFQNLCHQVAALVGGIRCKPARALRHTDLTSILYHSAFKFCRGKQASAVLPNSDAIKLRQNKLLGSQMLIFYFGLRLAGRQAGRQAFFS